MAETISEKHNIERHSISKNVSDRIEHDNDDDTTWSMSSVGGISRSSHDDGLVFKKMLTNSDENKFEDNNTFSSKIVNKEEYFELLAQNNKYTNYFYDGNEEILSNSDNDEQTNENEEDESLFNDNDRVSFTREQLVEYQQLTKLLRFVKSGGRRTTILSLALLNDFSLQDRSAFLAFKDSSTITVLLNFIEMFDRDIKLNALYVLENACQNSSFAYEIFRLGGIMTIIDSMSLDHVGINQSCTILLKILIFHRARRVVRRFGGISKLIALSHELFTENSYNTHQILSNIFKVILLLCKSEKNKFVCIRYGIRNILLKIILSVLNNLSSPVISLLAILLQIPIFRMQMINMDLVKSLINSIDSTNIELTRAICESLYYLSFDSNILKFIYESGFKKLKDLLEQINDPSIFCSITYILTEFIRNDTNLSNDIILNIIKFLKNSPDLLHLQRIIQSLNNLTKTSQTINLFKQENIFQDFVFYLQNQNNVDVQLNILSILQQCAIDKQAAQLIVDVHGLEELWTLFKQAPISVKIASGYTIKNCLVSIENHGELVRSFDGVFYLILNTLSTDHIDLLGITLWLIAEIAKDEYNLNILTDLDVVSKISQLNYLDRLELSKPLCNTIANLLDLKRNQEQFGNRRIMISLKNFLQLQDSDIFKPLTKAIYDLSLIPSNCVILHDVGVAMDLLKLIGDDDPVVQEKSANALRNMRQLLDANRQMQRITTKDISQISTKKVINKRNKCVC